MKKPEIIGLGCRLIIGVALTWSATPKIIDAGLFYHNIAAYGILDDTWNGIAATIVPWLELTLGLALFARVAALGAAVTAATMLTGFTALQGWGLATGIEAPCGCFDVGTDGQISVFTVGRVALLAAIASLAAYTELRAQRSGNVAVSSGAQPMAVETAGDRGA